MTYYPIENFEHYLLGKGDGDNEWSVCRIKKSGELKKLEGSIEESGHRLYCLCSDGKQITKGLHQLIAEMFLPIPKELLESEEILDAHHIDGSPQNNSISNLIWLTHSEHRRLHMEGNKNPMYGKPRPEGAGRPTKQVFQYTLDGELVAVWPSTMECGRNGFDHGHVVDCCKGKRKTHKGYRWSYTPL